jgi:hypothetical protein
LLLLLLLLLFIYLWRQASPQFSTVEGDALTHGMFVDSETRLTLTTRDGCNQPCTGTLLTDIRAQYADARGPHAVAVAAASASTFSLTFTPREGAGQLSVTLYGIPLASSPLPVRVNPLVEFHQLRVIVEVGATAAHAQQLVQWVATRTGRAANAAAITLRYRATRDGWTNANVQAKCLNQSRLLFVVRSAAGHLFGGFLAATYVNNGCWINDPQAFLFTLTNPHNVAPTMLPVSNRTYAFHPQFLVCFGGGNDLAIYEHAHTQTGSYSNLTHSYTDSTGRGNNLFSGAKQLGLITEVMAFAM